MSKLLILAPSGIGKTSSLRNLDPTTTGIINCDKKELPLKGWRVNYKTARTAEGKIDFDKSNYVETSSPANVLAVLYAWAKRPDLKTIVVDTITHMITQDYMANTIGKDFKAYQKMGKNFYDVIQFINNCDKDMIVMGHIEKRFNETGDIVYDMKSHGKILPLSFKFGETPNVKTRTIPSQALRNQGRCNDYPLCSGVDLSLN